MQNNTKTWLIDSIYLAAIIAIMFGTLLGSFPLQAPDGARYAEIPREMLALKDFITPHLNFIKYFEKPPLFYWMQTASIQLFGLSEWSMRFMNAFMALITCLITYITGRKLFDRKTGFLSALILATSVLYFAMAHLVTLDITVTTFLCGSLFSFIIGTQFAPGRYRNYCMWLMYVFAALAVMTKGLIGIIFPGATIFIWVLLFNKWREIKTYCLPSGIFIILLLSAPWHILVQLKNPEFYSYYFIKQHFLRYLTQFAGRSHLGYAMPIIVIAGFLPWAAFLPQSIKHSWKKIRQQRKKNQTIISSEAEQLVFLFIIPVFIFLFYGFSHSQLIPYFLPMFPPAAIITGKYLADLWQKKFSSGLKYGFIVIVIIAVLAAAYITMLPDFVPLFNNHTAKFLAYITAFLLIFCAIITLVSYFSYGAPQTITTLIVTIWLVLLTVYTLSGIVNTRTIKPITVILKPLLKPTDEIIAYNTYYQDLPFYLRRRITVVNWRNELAFGISQQPSSRQWMIGDQEFWHRWSEPKCKYLITNIKQYKKLLTTKDNHMNLIAKYQAHVLLDNSACN